MNLESSSQDIATPEEFFESSPLESEITSIETLESEEKYDGNSLYEYYDDGFEKENLEVTLSENGVIDLEKTYNINVEELLRKNNNP